MVSTAAPETMTSTARQEIGSTADPEMMMATTDHEPGISPMPPTTHAALIGGNDH